eukprot:1532061-Karenia_brevis.AAC.1
MALRPKAKKTSMELNLSQRMARTVSGKAAIMTGECRVGDLISFQREQGTHGNRSKRWSPAARIIGFGGSRKKVRWERCENRTLPYAQQSFIDQ